MHAHPKRKGVLPEADVDPAVTAAGAGAEPMIGPRPLRPLARGRPPADTLPALLASCRPLGAAQWGALMTLVQIVGLDHIGRVH